MSETETIARNLSGELARHRKTQAALAKELGMSEKTVSERLRGKGAFDTEQLEKTATMLGMSLYQLMMLLLQPIDGNHQIPTSDTKKETTNRQNRHPITKDATSHRQRHHQRNKRPRRRHTRCGRAKEVIVVTILFYRANRCMVVSPVEDFRRVLDMPTPSVPGEPRPRNNALQRLWNRIRGRRSTSSYIPRQRVFPGCPEDAVLAIDMAGGCVWIRGTSPNGWVPLDIPGLHARIPEQFRRSEE